jgi:hypothetical protein
MPIHFQLTVFAWNSADTFLTISLRWLRRISHCLEFGPIPAMITHFSGSSQCRLPVRRVLSFLLIAVGGPQPNPWLNRFRINLVAKF